jgi:glycine/D-amino acid oxidase-like deaminating enzyme
MKDICIVGLGLAGMAVSSHAESNNLTFDVISDNSQKSSRVAGGLLNPVSVKRMKPVWQVEKYLDYAKSFYSKLSKRLNINVFSEMPIQVFIHNTEQENNWYEAHDKPRLKPFISSNVYSNPVSSNLSCKMLGKINASLVHLDDLLPAYTSHLKSINAFITESFCYDDLRIDKHAVIYKQQKYKNLVFCEGFGVTKNPFFNNLGIYGNKGDYIIFLSKKLQLNNIAKAKYFLIPLGNDLYKFGATYQRQPLNHEPSDDAKAQMLEALDKMILVPYKIIDQVCGIRPTTKDRKPIAGTHNEYKNIHILNGFGSRGVMTSPILGQELISHIFKNKPLDKEVSIERIYDRS